MTLPIRPGFSLPVVAQGVATTVRPAQAGFAARLVSAGVTSATPAASGIGRQVISTVLQGAQSARSYASLLTGGGASPDETAELTKMIDDIKTYIQMNSIFDAGNVPTVEKT